MASPSELFSCVDAKMVLTSPINNSTSKTHWSFARDSRFKKPQVLCDSFYQLSGIQNNKNRKAGIGYGKKTDLDAGKHPHNQTPSPDKYEIKSFVDTNKKHGKGYSALFNREEVAPMSYIDLEKAKVPGPGRYEEHRKRDTPYWSMRPRTSTDIFPKTTARDNPSPSHYENTEELGRNPTGKYHTSKYRNSKAHFQSKSERFSQSVNYIPGPGGYNPQNDMSGQGKYVLSRTFSSGKRTFMEGRRQSFIDLTLKRNSTPGPGTYRAPSDFGYYDNKQERIERLSKSQLLKKEKRCSSARQR